MKLIKQLIRFLQNETTENAKLPPPKLSTFPRETFINVFAIKLRKKNALYLVIKGTLRVTFFRSSQPDYHKRRK